MSKTCHGTCLFVVGCCARRQALLSTSPSLQSANSQMPSNRAVSPLRTWPGLIIGRLQCFALHLSLESASVRVGQTAGTGRRRRHLGTGRGVLGQVPACRHLYACSGQDESRFQMQTINTALISNSYNREAAGWKSSVYVFCWWKLSCLATCHHKFPASHRLLNPYTCSTARCTYIGSPITVQRDTYCQNVACCWKAPLHSRTSPPYLALSLLWEARRQDVTAPLAESRNLFAAL